MYVSYGAACTFPNSSTPMSKARIARQDAHVARVGARFIRGNAALDSLVTRLGGTGIGPVPGADPQPGAADFRNSPSCATGVTSGGQYGGRLLAVSVPPPPSFGGKWLPVSPLAMGAHPGAASGNVVAPGGAGIADASPRAPSPAGVACIYPVVKPLQTVFPAVAPVRSPGPVVATVAPMTAAPIAPAVAVSKPDPALLCLNITPDNVCEAARAGCFLYDQLDPQQWLACARAGWSGNQNLYPWVLMRGGAQNGRRFGMVNAQPKSAAGALPNAPGLGALALPSDPTSVYQPANARVGLLGQSTTPTPDIPMGLWIAGAALLALGLVSHKGRR
jgi:hypothetical protein